MGVWLALTLIAAHGEVAEQAALASKSLLVDVAAAGKRLVAVGERGHVLLSDDGGHHWLQADAVPTQTLLTAVCFADERHGIAVGHDEIVITTQDAGRTWQRTHFAPESQQPLLDVWCGAEGRAIAVGAYGAYFESTDGGASWVGRQFAPQRQAGTGSEEEELRGDPHLNRIAAAAPSRFYIASEAGRLYRSDDQGGAWIELPSPYEGSFFGVLPLAGDALLAYGLRGHLFRSNDAGMSWRKIETGTVALLNDAIRLPDGRVVVLGLSGTVLVGGDEGYALIQQSDRKGLSAGLPLGSSSLAVVGEAGATRIELPVK